MAFPGKLEFSTANNHTLVVEELDESALEYFRNTDPDFTISEISFAEDEKPVNPGDKALDDAADSQEASTSTPPPPRGRTQRSTAG